MKKLMLLAGLYCLQSGLYAASYIPKEKHDVVPMNATERAKANFRENFAWVQDAAWFNTGDDNIYCIFHQGNIVDRVFYDQRGYWQYTLINYPASVLAKDVKERVQNNFPGYQISYVNEIRSDNFDPVYMISIEDENNIKVVRVSGDEFEVKQVLQKS
jgi:hypothetical protein